MSFGNGEGIGGNSFAINRSVKCSDLLSQVHSQGVLLLRAPPYSGKTSMITLTAELAKKSGAYQQIYSISLLNWIKTQVPLQDFIHSVSNKTMFQHLGQHDQNHLIIIDETQKMYDTDEAMWNVIKSHMNTSTRQATNVRLLLVASYGESPSITGTAAAATPIAFTDALGFEFLQFTVSEWHELINGYNQSDKGVRVPIPSNIEEALYRLTAGHAGLATRCLSGIVDKFYNTSSTLLNNPTSDSEILEYLASNELLSLVLNTRAVGFKHQDFSQEQIDFLHNVIVEDGISEPSSAPAVITMHELVVRAVLARTVRQRFDFPSPLVRTIVINRIYAPVKSSTTASLTFSAFLERTIASFSPKILQDTLSKGADAQLYERQLQCEFYRCAVRTLGGLSYCSPDVGKLFGSDGFLDFYVNSTRKWGVEITRNGDRLQEHCARFEPEGKYRQIEFNEKIVLNFHQLKSFTRKPTPKYKFELTIIYVPGESKFVVRRFNPHGAPVDKTIVFQGDNLVR